MSGVVCAREAQLTNVIHLAERRPFPRPRFTPTVNGTVILTIDGPDLEEHLDVRAARALLNELADAVDVAEHLARSGT